MRSAISAPSTLRPIAQVPRQIQAGCNQAHWNSSSVVLHPRSCRSRVVVRAVNVEELIEEVDLVVYRSHSTATATATGNTSQGNTSQGIKLGRVMRVMPSGQIEMEPLVEEEAGVYVADEQASSEPVDANQLISLVAYELSQRQDKVSNPHGEHAHDIYRLLEPLITML